MRILPNYLVRLHAAPFAFTLTALTSLLLLNQIAKRFESLVGKGLEWTVIFEFFALTIPFLLAMTIPMAVLVTVLYTFSRLAADHEITALKGAGVSTLQMMRPVLGAALIVAAGSFLIGDQIVPRTNHRLRTLMTDIDRKKPVFAVREQVINEVRRNKIFLRSARVDASTQRLRDVTIWDLSTNDRKRVIYADSGEMAFSTNQEDLYVTLYDGVVRDIDRTDPSVFEQTEFVTNIILVPDVGNELNRTISDNFRSDREMGTCELAREVRRARREAEVTRLRTTAVRVNLLRQLVGLAPQVPDTNVAEGSPSLYCRHIEPLLSGAIVTPLEAQQPQDTLAGPRRFRGLRAARVATSNAYPPVIPYNEIRALETRQNQAEIRAARNEIEMHKKYALAAACVVFAFIGIPIALRFPRGGVDLVIGVSIVVFGIYYVGLIAGETLGDRLTIPPAFAMWAANIVFTVVGSVFLYWMRRSTTPRSRLRTALGLLPPKRTGP